jgi:PAS domain S-box-containing protein
MGIRIRVLIVEDSTDDAELVLRQLRRAGYDPVFERVQTAEEMKTALEREAWDLVVSDFSMPQFDALAALKLLIQSGHDLPFIVVSGTIGEDIAVTIMKTGAHDYILKQNLTRFVPAVQRELREAENRRQQRLTEQAKQRLEIERDEFVERLKQENEDLAALTRVTANAISTLDLDELLLVLLGRIVEVMRADAATILLADAGELRVRASAGAVDLSDSTYVVRVGEGFAGSIASRMKSVYVEDAAVDPLVKDPLIRERGIRSMLGVPLKRNGTLIGVLHADWLTVRPCRDRDVRLLEITSERCGAAIQNAQLYQEARRIAAALTESEARLRRLSTAIEQTADAVLITDREGIIQYVNAAFEDITGYNAAEVVGRKPSFLKSGRHRPEFYEQLWRTITSGAPFRAVFVNRHKNGSLLYHEKTITPIKDQSGNITHFVSTTKDVTERQRTNAELRLQSAALNAAANIIVITDRNGTIEFVNPAFTALTGYRAEEALGKNQGELIKSGLHDHAFYKDLWDCVLAGHAWRGEMTNRRKDGSLYTVDQTITSVNDARGEIGHFITIQQDLSEQKRLEARFLQAQKMEVVGRLASGIAHDFNNLLTVINGTADLALTDLKEGDPLRTDLQDIAQAGESAASLTRQLLAFSRQQIMTPDFLNLSTLVADMQDMLRRLIGEDIALVVGSAKDVGSIMADPVQIKQVVMNLAVNARDAMPNGGTLTIETRDVALDEAFAAEHPSVKPGPHVMLAISDTGEGMDEATRGQIFEPFFTTKELGKGTGLGLATVYGIVSQSGGSISAHSELGKGTTFRIYLPLVEAVARNSQSTPAVTSVEATETVLIVEDEAAVCRLAKRVLEVAGYRVLTASNGFEALTLLEQHDGPVHLMLTDMVMPGMSGRDLAIQLDATHPQTKVLYTSGYTDDAILHNRLPHAAADFIGKPYTIAELTRKVREVLDS